MIHSSEPARRCVSVVMPMYNEEKTLPKIAKAVLAQPVVAELIIVDDGSRDNSWQIASALAAGETRVRVEKHAKNLGKGAALRTGIALATAEYVIIQDADLEYDPADYSRLLEPILSGRADVVFGSRFIGSEAHRVLYFWHWIGNRFVTTVSNAFTNLNLSDMETCYKVFRRELFEQIEIEEDGFGVEPELTAKVANLNARVYEVAISYHGRTYAEGKKVGWRDGFHALWCICRYSLFVRH